MQSKKVARKRKTTRVNETPTSFEIREIYGAANIKVSYQIVAKRKEFANERLKKVALPNIDRGETDQEGTPQQ